MTTDLVEKCARALQWQRVPPRDPFLLRRIGKADLWLVVAMWDLTEVERAALATRLSNA